jgi:hypothetical protein
MLDPSEYELDVSFDTTHEELILLLRKQILRALRSAKLRANRVERKSRKKNIGKCLVCDKSQPIAKWGVCLACVPQLEVDMLARKINVLSLKNSEAGDQIVGLFISSQKEIEEAKAKKQRKPEPMLPIEEIDLSFDEDLNFNELENLGQKLTIGLAQLEIFDN